MRGSAARLRVLIIDACPLGPPSRAPQGGRPAPAIRLALTQAAGVVVLTASAAGEAAQESPAVGASFFTHHLLSGLLGAADANRDGKVTITEAYDYAYSNTLRDSSATLAGMQHPSYRYDVRGQGEVELTTVRDSGARAQLVIPAGLDVLVMRGSATGAVIAAARTPTDSTASLSLPPGRMFVRARTAQALFEQEGHAARRAARARRRCRCRHAAMDRIEFTRAGPQGAGRTCRSSPASGSRRSPTPAVADRRTYCVGGGVHGILVYRSISVVPRLGVCREQFTTTLAETETTEVVAAIGVNVHRDLSRRWSVQVGPELGLAYFHQSVGPFSDPPTRDLLGSVLTVQGGVDLDVGGGFALGARAMAATSFPPAPEPEPAAGPESPRCSPGARRSESCGTSASRATHPVSATEAVNPAEALLDLAERRGVPAVGILRAALPDVLEDKLEGWINGEIEKLKINGKPITAYAGEIAMLAEIAPDPVRRR